MLGTILTRTAPLMWAVFIGLVLWHALPLPVNPDTGLELLAGCAAVAGTLLAGQRRNTERLRSAAVEDLLDALMAPAAGDELIPASPAAAQSAGPAQPPSAG